MLNSHLCRIRKLRKYLLVDIAVFFVINVTGHIATTKQPDFYNSHSVAEPSFSAFDAVGWATGRASGPGKRAVEWVCVCVCVSVAEPRSAGSLLSMPLFWKR